MPARSVPRSRRDRPSIRRSTTAPPYACPADRVARGEQRRESGNLRALTGVGTATTKTMHASARRRRRRTWSDVAAASSAASTSPSVVVELPASSACRAALGRVAERTSACRRTRPPSGRPTQPRPDDFRGDANIIQRRQRRTGRRSSVSPLCAHAAAATDAVVRHLPSRPSTGRGSFIKHHRRSPAPSASSAMRVEIGLPERTLLGHDREPSAPSSTAYASSRNREVGALAEDARASARASRSYSRAPRSRRRPTAAAARRLSASRM